LFCRILFAIKNISLIFYFSPEQEAVRNTVGRLCRDELVPLVTDAEENEA